MKCPHCNQEHPEEFAFCPTTGKKLKRACPNPNCSVYGEYLFHLEQVACPVCGTLFIHKNNGHEFVDLGLSVKWATCNVGASSPEEYGNYFAWGETCPKKDYSWSTLKYCNSIADPLTDNKDNFSKYNMNADGIQDFKSLLDLDDDAAHINWGGSWRMPSNAEFNELINDCFWAWTSMEGKNGYKITSESNGNSIFLPATGWGIGTSIEDEGIKGGYWSRSLGVDGLSNGAKNLFFVSRNYLMFSGYRKNGLSVRPVCP